MHLIELLGILIDMGYSSYSSWYMQGFRQGLACWSSSQSYLLWNFRWDIWPYFVFSQWCDRRLRVVLDIYIWISEWSWFWKSPQEYLVNAGVPQGFILDPKLFFYNNAFKKTKIKQKNIQKSPHDNILRYQRWGELKF